MTRFLSMLVAAIFVAGALLVASARGSDTTAQVAAAQSGAELAAQLGCATCHGDMGVATTIRDRAPSLAAAGTRYRPSYLYEYLLSPERVRPHIGAARMPGFHLDEREALALTLYLLTFEVSAPAPPVETTNLDAESLIREELGCLTCHALRGSGSALAPALDAVGARLNEGFLLRYLGNPQNFDGGGVMPSLFFEQTGTSWRPVVPNAAGKLDAVTQYLLRAGGDAGRAAERRFDATRAEHRDVTGAMGAEIARALNCGGCHGGLPAATAPTGPPLATSARRLRPAWLRSFLHEPTAVRPAGFRPGEGSRMPDFRLSDSEVDALVGFLQPGSDGAPEPRSPTPFQAAKAQAFLAERLPCLGCHRLNGDGGRIGPDLTGVGARLTPQSIRATIADPQGEAPGSIMPRHPMPDDRIDLLATYLAQQTNWDTSSAYVSLTGNRAATRQPDAQSGEGIYLAYCAHCHGENGGGDGWNSPFLPVPPTRHADSSYMSSRPDDTLYDGIHAGGYILNRSHRMPAFGQRLSDPQIRAVVAYLRELCGCQGPAWSRDGRGANRER